MSNIPSEKKGLFADPNGDTSSGRVMKIISFIIAGALAFIGVWILVKADTQNAVALGDYIFKAIVAFLAVATSAEVVQKVTGR